MIMKKTANFFPDMTALVGHTPLVRLNKLVPHRDSLFLVKLETEKFV